MACNFELSDETGCHIRTSLPLISLTLKTVLIKAECHSAFLFFPYIRRFAVFVDIHFVIILEAAYEIETVLFNPRICEFGRRNFADAKKLGENGKTYTPPQGGWKLQVLF